jgi:hypothetical protein
LRFFSRQPNKSEFLLIYNILEHQRSCESDGMLIINSQYVDSTAHSPATHPPHL